MVTTVTVVTVTVTEIEFIDQNDYRIDCDIEFREFLIHT